MATPGSCIFGPLAPFRLGLLACALLSTCNTGHGALSRTTYTEMYQKADRAFNVSDYKTATENFEKCLQALTDAGADEVMPAAEAEQEYDKVYAKLEYLRLNVFLPKDEPFSANFTAAPPPNRGAPLETEHAYAPDDAAIAAKKLTGVYETPLLSAEECARIIEEAEHVGDWRERLAYNTREVTLLQMHNTLAWFKKPSGVREQIFALVRRQFGLRPKVFLSVKSSNVIRYDAHHNETSFVQLHSDGKNRLTFNVLLSDLLDFAGGGTHFPHIQKTLTPPTGTMITYYGGSFHSSNRVTGGRRYVWQGFIDVATSASEKLNVWFIQKALAENPRLPDAYTDLARSLQKLGRASEEVHAYEGALKAGHPHDHLLFARIAATHHREGQHDLARKALEKALHLAPKDEMVLKVADAILRESPRRPPGDSDDSDDEHDEL